MTARVWQKIDKEIIEILPSHAEISQLQGKTNPCVSKIIQKSLFSIFKVNWSTNIHKLQSSPSFIALNKFSILKVFSYFNLFILSGMWNAH